MGGSPFGRCVWNNPNAAPGVPHDAHSRIDTCHLTAADVADAFKTQTPVIYGWIKTEGLPARRVGRRWLIDPAELAEWVENNGQPAPQPSGPQPPSDWLAEQLPRFHRRRPPPRRRGSARSGWFCGVIVAPKPVALQSV